MALYKWPIAGLSPQQVSKPLPEVHSLHTLPYSFPEGLNLHQLSNGSPILSPTICTITPLITNKQLLQVKLTLKQRLKRNEGGGKTRDYAMRQLPVFGVPPHEAKNKSMVTYESGDTPSLIDDLLKEGNFPHILQHQINTMCSAYTPKL